MAQNTILTILTILKTLLTIRATKLTVLTIPAILTIRYRLTYTYCCATRCTLQHTKADLIQFKKETLHYKYQRYRNKN